MVGNAGGTGRLNQQLLRQSEKGEVSLGNMLKKPGGKS